jgi:hypothetical protein
MVDGLMRVGSDGPSIAREDYARLRLTTEFSAVVD